MTTQAVEPTECPFIFGFGWLMDKNFLVSLLTITIFRKIVRVTHTYIRQILIIIWLTFNKIFN